MAHRFLVAGFALVLVYACAREPEREVLTCSGNCGSRPGQVGHEPPPATGGTSGEGGAGGAESEGVVLEGEIVAIDDLGALTGALFRDLASLRVERQGSGSVTGSWNGVDSFSIERVRRDPAVWVEVTPAPGDVLPSVQPVDTTRDPDGVVFATLSLVRESQLEVAYNVLSTPVTRDPGAAQLVLLVSSPNGTAIAGARVTSPGAEVVIYAVSGSFSDIATETDATGLVLLANVPAVAWPGSLATVSVSGAFSEDFELRLVAGAVTLAAVGP